MSEDKEMVDFFVKEIDTLRAEMSMKVSTILKGKLGDLDVKMFEDFGQMIDRIYGTAATLGYEEIATYTKHLKDVCYMASESDNEKGHKKTIQMMIECIGLLEELKNCIYDKDQLIKYAIKMKVEGSRAERLGRAEFFSIDKTSCD
jgi:chemotaxis protein histidine kinase CheA